MSRVHGVEKMKIMRRWVTAALLVGLFVAGLVGAARLAKAQPAVQNLRIYVLDGGSLTFNTPEMFGRTRETVKNTNMSAPAYLIVHPRGTLLFDTGIGDRYVGRFINQGWLNDRPNPPSSAFFVVVTKTLKSQLEAIGYPPSKIDYLALSHPHNDHIGNANDFAGSTFLVHQGDWDYMFGLNRTVNPSYAALKDSKKKIIEGDYDVFGDGTVMLLSTPGHTPGHQSLYVKLARTGGVVVSGDVWHYPEDRTDDTMPADERGPGILEASRVKLNAFLAKTGAQLWIPHDLIGFSKQKHAPEYYD